MNSTSEYLQQTLEQADSGFVQQMFPITL